MQLNNISLTNVEEEILLYSLNNSDIQDYNERYHDEDVQEIIEYIKNDEYHKAKDINIEIVKFVLKFCFENSVQYAWIKVNQPERLDEIKEHGESLALKISKVIEEKVRFRDYF